MKYSCEPCGYESHSKFCLEQHLSTQKHKKKVNEIKQLTQSLPKVNTSKMYICSYCKEHFSHKSSLSRHSY